jgi:hypothetical protein
MTMLEIQTTEQLRYYVDTLKMLFEHAYRENNREVCSFVRRYLDGHLPKAAMVSLMADTTPGGALSPAEQRLQAVATIMAAPVKPNPPMTDDGKGNRVPEDIPLTRQNGWHRPEDKPDSDGDGGIKARLPDGPKPKSPSPATAKPVW